MKFQTNENQCKYIATFKDYFSGAIESKICWLDSEQLRLAKEQIESEKIVFTQYKDSINWQWVLIEIKKAE